LTAESKKPTAVRHLLEQGDGLLRKLRAGTAEADRTLAAVRDALPPEIAGEVWGASLKGTTLTTLVQSAAWGTRLRYVASHLTAPIAAALGVPVEEIKVKVRANPRKGRSASG
jgi:hypothetical protein